jgi:hypothetical protein
MLYSNYIVILGCYRIGLQPGNTDVVDLVDSHITQTVAMLTICLQDSTHITVRTYCHQLYNLNGACALPSQVLQATFFSRALHSSYTSVVCIQASTLAPSTISFRSS